jgi:phosphoenolpyruvate carboxykinase (ATP)
VETPGYTDDIWWGKVNIKTTEKAWNINYQRAIDFLNTRNRLILVDGYAGWDPKYRIKVRVICSRAYHALFMHNMMIRPTKEELVRDFSHGADYYIINSGVFPASPLTETLTSTTSVNVNFKERKMAILGT